MTTRPVCLKCLNTIQLDELIQPSQSEFYHMNCHDELITLRNNKITEVLEDVTETIIFDQSDYKIKLKQNFDKIIGKDNVIGKYIDLSSDDKILDQIKKDTNYYTNDNFNNIINSDEYAMDIAGNMVKIDKKYIMEQ